MNAPASGRGPEAGEPLHNFTPRAEQVLALARQEADRFNHNFIGTEHVLLGLFRLGQGTAVNVLKKTGLDLEAVRKEVERQVGTGPEQKIIGNIPYTPRVKKVLALAAKEATALHHQYVGTEHILLGLLREGDGVAARVLRNSNIELEKTRQDILRELDPNFQPAPGMGAAAETPRTTGSAGPPRDAVDTSKRYDVYCTERNQQVVIYRNALFKGKRKLLRDPGDRSGYYEIFYEFVELEQSNGQPIFVARSSILKFCEHGPTPNSEEPAPGRTE